jgi:ABC-type sulfate transport system substrate-binding protein
MLFSIPSILASVLLIISIAAPVSAATITLLNVSYDPTRALLTLLPSRRT